MSSTVVDARVEGDPGPSVSWYRPLDRTGWLLIGAAIAAYTVLVWWLSPVPHWGDALRNLNYAAAWPDLPPIDRPARTMDHHLLRVGLLWPTRAVIEVLGFGESAYRTAAWLTGLPLAIGVPLLAYRMFGAGVTALSLTVLLLNPFFVRTDDLLTLGHVLPDIPAAGLVTLGFALLLAGLVRDDRVGTAALVGAGAALGWAYLVREFVPPLYLVIPVAAWATRARWTRLAWVAGPMLVALATELLVNATLHGDALLRFRVAGEHGSTRPEALTPLDVVVRSLRAFTVDPRGLVFVVAFVVLVAGAVARRDVRLRLLAIWAGTLTLFLMAVGGLVDPAAPSLRLELFRYWLPAIPAVAIGASAMVWWALRDRPSRGAAAIGAALLGAWIVTTGVTGVIDVATAPRDRAWDELRAWVATDGERYDPLWTDRRSDLTLELYVRDPGGRRLWDGEVLGRFPQYEPDLPARIRGGAVLYTDQGPRRPLAPDRGTLVFESADAELRVYRLDP